MLTESEAKAITDAVLGMTRAEDAVVTVSQNRNSHLRFAANSFLTNGRQDNTTVSVTVWMDRKQGQATGNDLSAGGLRKIVETAESVARLSPVDREYVPTIGPQAYRPRVDFEESTVNLSVADRARRIHEIISACERAGVVGAGFHQAQGTAAGTATKRGNFRYERSSLAGLTVTARTREGDGSGFFQRSHWDISRLDSERVANEAVRKAQASRNPRALEAGVYPVILEPQAVADLLGFLFRFGFDARSAEEGRSALSAPGGGTRLGQQVFDPKINVFSDPRHSELPGPAAAQDGLPSEKVVLVEKGVVKSLVYSRYWARQRMVEPTRGPVNAILESAGPTATLEEMIKASDRALLVTRFWYIRGVNPRIQLNTGLTRDGLWLVENGEIKHAVRNFRFNESILEMLAPGNVEAISRPERVSGSENRGSADSLLPALKLRRFHFTSQSEAV